MSLCKDKQEKEYLIYRLIASAFYKKSLNELKDQECHHCNICNTDHSSKNLVFIPSDIHLIMHKTLDERIIKYIGEQVKDLKGNEKTDRFIELTKREIKKKIDELFL